MVSNTLPADPLGPARPLHNTPHTPSGQIQCTQMLLGLAWMYPFHMFWWDCRSGGGGGSMVQSYFLVLTCIILFIQYRGDMGECRRSCASREVDSLDLADCTAEHPWEDRICYSTQWEQRDGWQTEKRIGESSGEKWTAERGCKRLKSKMENEKQRKGWKERWNGGKNHWKDETYREGRWISHKYVFPAEEARP